MVSKYLYNNLHLAKDRLIKVDEKQAHDITHVQEMSSAVHVLGIPSLERYAYFLGETASTWYVAIFVTVL